MEEDSGPNSSSTSGMSSGDEVSDVSVSWGPVTLREVRKAVNQPSRRIKRRRTDDGSFISAPEEVLDSDSQQHDVSSTTATTEESSYQDAQSGHEDSGASTSGAVALVAGTSRAIARGVRTLGVGTSGAGNSGAGTSGAGTSGAGTSAAGTSGAGTSGAGTSRAGTSRAGTSGAGTSRAGTSGAVDLRAGTSGTVARGASTSGPMDLRSAAAVSTTVSISDSSEDEDPNRDDRAEAGSNESALSVSDSSELEGLDCDARAFRLKEERRRNIEMKLSTSKLIGDTISISSSSEDEQDDGAAGVGPVTADYPSMDIPLDFHAPEVDQAEAVDPVNTSTTTTLTTSNAEIGPTDYAPVSSGASSTHPTVNVAPDFNPPEMHQVGAVGPIGANYPNVSLSLDLFAPGMMQGDGDAPMNADLSVQLDFDAEELETESTIPQPNDKSRTPTLHLSNLRQSKMQSDSEESISHSEGSHPNNKCTNEEDQQSSLTNSQEESEIKFNDTMDEIEMALKQGLGYTMPGEEENTSPPNESCSDTETQESSYPNQSSFSDSELEEHPFWYKPLDQLKPDNARHILKRTALPRPVNKFSYVHSPVSDYIKHTNVLPMKTREDFRKPAPKSATKTKILTPVSSKRQQDNFKNIMSPVGIYIKNTPNAVLKQNVPTNNISQIRSSCSIPRYNNTSANSNNESVSNELPEVVYRPAKKTITTPGKNVVLPLSIQKLVQEPIITKHEKRVKNNLNETSLHRRLLQEDLTTIVTDDSEENDVSFLTKRQAFRK